MTNEHLPAGQGRTLPDSFREGADMVRSAGELAATLGTVVSGALRSLTELEALRGKIDLEMKRLDNDLQLAVLAAQKDMKLYETALPVFGQQLDRIQNRLDMAMEKALELINGDLTDDNARRRAMVMDLLSATQSNFDALVAKLLK